MATGGLSNREEIVYSFIILDNDDEFKYLYSHILVSASPVDLKRNAKIHFFQIILMRTRLQSSSSL